MYARTKQDFALSYGARKPVTRPLDAEAVQQLNSEMLVSIKGGEVVGACLLTKSDEYVVAQLLAVVEQFEKTGIGSALLDAACSIARDHTTTGSSRLRAGCLLVPATSKWWAGSSKAHWLRPMDLTSGSFAAEAAAKQLQHLPLLFRLGENDPILRWQCDEPRVGWLEAEETPQPPLRLEAPAAAKPGPVLAPIAESSGYKLFLNSQAASGYTGVSKLSNGSYHAQYRPLAATKAFAGKTVFLGMHETAVGAAVAYARYCESQGSTRRMRLNLRRAGTRSSRSFRLPPPRLLQAVWMRVMTTERRRRRSHGLAASAAQNVIWLQTRCRLRAYGSSAIPAIDGSMASAPASIRRWPSSLNRTDALHAVETTRRWLKDRLSGIPAFAVEKLVNRLSWRV